MASKLFMEGKQLTGAVGNALKINCKDKDGKKSTVQAELNKFHQQLGGFEPIIDETGKITGYKTSVGGADTVFPFSGKPKNVVYNAFSPDKNVYHSYTVEEDGCYLLISGNTSTGGTTALYSFAGADVNNPDTSVLEENISRWSLNNADQSHINVYYYECKAGDILTTYSYDSGGGYRFSWVTIIKL